ncbi:MAG: DNA primase [Pseudomonadota bacterium]
MAGRIPQSFIEDLIARADIIEVLGSRIELRKAGREYKALCPFHGEKTPSFTISPNKGFYHCFGCGAHGTALGFLMEHDHLSFVEAVEELAGMMSLEVPREAGTGPARDGRIDHLFEVMERVATVYTKALKDHPPAIEYLQRRGIDGNTARDFRIGYAPDAWDTVLKAMPDSQNSVELLMAAGLIIERDSGGHYDRFRDRIMFPIRDARGRIVGFGGRVLDKGEPKYLNSPETVLFHKGRELYGLYEVRQKLRDIPRLVVVEGYMDVVGLARYGVRFAVATLGTATTGDHIERLFRLTDQVVFSFDGDRAGRKAAWRALENALPKLTDGRELRFAFMPDGQDPDSLVASQGVKAFEQCLDESLPLSDFVIGELTAQVEADTAEGRAKVAAMAKPLLAKMPEGFYRETLLERIASEIHLDEKKVRQMMGGPATIASDQPRQRSRLTSANPRQSPMRRAITLLLHEPAAALRFDLKTLENLERPGADILRQLVATIQARPDIQPAVLLEQWRDHPNYVHLEKLAGALQESDSVTDSAAELAGCYRQLEQMVRDDRYASLVSKSADSGLSLDEKQELVNLNRIKVLTEKSDKATINQAEANELAELLSH